MLLATAALAASLLRPAFTPTPPGTLDAPAWRAATHERFGGTDAYLLEDDRYLYVGFSAARTKNDSRDAVTLYLWSDRAAYQFSVDANGVRTARCSTGLQNLPKWSASEQTEKAGYTVTMRLPRKLFSSGGQSRWLVQLARVPGNGKAETWPSSGGAPGDVIDAVAFENAPQGVYTAGEAAQPGPHPKIAAALGAQAQSGALADKIAQLWPTKNLPILAPPGIASDAQGVAVAQRQDDVAFANVDAKAADGTEQNAQSLGWTSPDRRASAGAERVASTDGSTYDVTQALSFAYDNLQNMRFSAGVAADRGSSVEDGSQANYDFYDFTLYGKHGTFDMRWNDAGPEYNPSYEQAPAPGTAGYTLSLTRAFGNVSLDMNANRYRDDLGNLSYADERAAISAALSPALTFDLDAAENAATQYALLPYAQTGAAFSYASGGREARVSYHEDRFASGDARQTDLTAGVPIPALGTLQVQHSETAVFGMLSGMLPQQSNSASLLHKLDHGYVSVGYQDASGAANMTFSFEDRLPIGLLRATYYNPNTLFSSPNFSIKLLPL